MDFGPESEETLNLIREKISQGMDIRCILGNHELYSLMGNKSFQGNTYGFQGELTSQIRSGMSVENREFIEGLPIEMPLRVTVNGIPKKIKLIHFPKDSRYEKDGDDSTIYGRGHGSHNFEKPNCDYIIYGHEHRTESTTGNQVGTVGTEFAENTESGERTVYMNLPSSGCVHGYNTTYVVLKDSPNGFEPEVVVVNYDKKRTAQKIFEKNKGKNAEYFGVTREEAEEVGI